MSIPNNPYFIITVRFAPNARFPGWKSNAHKTIGGQMRSARSKTVPPEKIRKRAWESDAFFGCKVSLPPTAPRPELYQRKAVLLSGKYGFFRTFPEIFLKTSTFGGKVGGQMRGNPYNEGIESRYSTEECVPECLRFSFVDRGNTDICFRQL